MSRRVIYSMTVSLDGYIADPNGKIDWSAPDDELHRFHNDRVREQGAQLCGRRLYETMLYWEDLEEQDPSAGETERDFARIWREMPKVVFSGTLDSVEGNWRLAKGRIADEVARLKEEADGDIGVGGAELAATCIRQGLVDEFELFVAPVVLGGGTPYFPPLDQRLELELVETRTFAAPVTYLHYRRA